MEENNIQTLHPDSSKRNKSIAAEKYEAVKTAMLAILQDSNPTHSELMEALHERLHPTFSGNAQWYGETVKLDLEARKIIERTRKKPATYRIVQAKFSNETAFPARPAAAVVFDE